MADCVTTYNPRDVNVYYGGNLIQGFAEGTFISAARANEDWTVSVGSDGIVHRSKNPDLTGTVDITLAQTGDGNRMLSYMYDLQSTLDAGQQKQGLGVEILEIQDPAGNTLVRSQGAWIQKPADVELSKEISDRVWSLMCCDLQMNIGTDGLEPDQLADIKSKARPAGD